MEGSPHSLHSIAHCKSHSNKVNEERGFDNQKQWEVGITWKDMDMGVSGAIFGVSSMALNVKLSKQVNSAHSSSATSGQAIFELGLIALS